MKSTAGGMSLSLRPEGMVRALDPRIHFMCPSLFNSLLSTCSLQLTLAFRFAVTRKVEFFRTWPTLRDPYIPKP
jgi:hypothetical protein